MPTDSPRPLAKEQFEAVAPVDTATEQRDTSEPTPQPTTGVALCLSGGGYRAMLFHLGALWRLNELAYLRKLTRVSSVSGGSITAAQLGLRWGQLSFDANGIATAFDAQVTQPIRHLASQTIDVVGILVGLFGPGTISDQIVKAYDKFLYGGATLQALPDDQSGPRFVFNATNVQSGALWRFSRPYMRDYRVGMVANPTIPLARAVAASSAFPPFLSPARLALKASDFVPASGADLQREPFTTNVVLTDGGVYDNLGLETAWRQFETVLVSDGGGQMSPEPSPHADWARHSYRINDLIDNQVRSLRKRQLIDAYKRNMRRGTYWGIRSHLADYGLTPPSPLPCPAERTLQLATYPTRLAKVEDRMQEWLINWGYAVCDTAMRRHVATTGSAPPGFPYPHSAV